MSHTRSLRLASITAAGGYLVLANIAMAQPQTQPAQTMPTTEPSISQPIELPKDNTPAAARSGSDDLTKLSLEDLMNVEVTSVSRQKQRIADAPAAITVINQDDIQRSGLTNLPDLMRLVPGMDVERVDANKWLVGARGNFSGLFADDLLVLMDGRTLYSPLFGGVFWDQQDYILQDLQRIEVIRGPGATLWGSNAVNGVINITTKDARDTQGWLLNGLGGNEEQNAAVRFGGQIDDKTFFRVYGKFRNFDDFFTAADNEAHDGWQDYRGGFRIDRYATPHDTFTLQGDVYTSRQDEQLLAPVLGPPFSSQVNDLYNSSGANILGRWRHQISDTADFSLQMYYDEFARDQAFFDYKQHIYDIDFQSRFALSRHQEVVWGFGGRLDTDRTEGGVFGSFIPPRQDNYLLNAFVQDGISIIPDRLVWFIGSKFEYNNYTHMEYQPSTRLLWTPDSHNTVWGAVSRAVRIPARWENSLSLNAADTPTPAGIPAQVLTVGNPNLKSEQLTSFELGYRVQPAKTLSFDVATFFNRYDHMHSTDPLPTSIVPTPTPHVLVPLGAGNNISGETFGAELAANWQVNSKWRLSGSYSFAQFQFHTKGLDPTTEAGDENSSPRNQFQLHSYYDILRNLQLNSSLYYAERTGGGATSGAAPSIMRADVSMTWRPWENLEITGGVQNIFDDRHPEFGTASVFVNSEVPRTYFGEVTWRF
jgi:iron complex outermembrane receptor protein